MLTIRDEQMKALADARPGKPMIVPCELTWVEVRLVDAEMHPVAGEEYRIRLPDSSIVTGSLDDEGKARFDGILAGQCLVCFPNIDSREWRRV